MKTCIIIAGATATGKTSLAIDIASYFNTEIISADSRQCYREMNIGVAKPTPEQLERVHHHFINSHSIHEEVSAALFEKYALNAAASIFQKADVAVMCGGTGLYINAFTNGMDNIPPTPAIIRNEITNNYSSSGISWLQEQLKQKDPGYFKTGETSNPRRLMRALEVVLATGNSILSYRSGSTVERSFRVITFVLDVIRPVLYERINARVDEMIFAGLENEALSLLPFRYNNALQTVGYREFFDYFDGSFSKQKAIDLIKQNTRHYAKRQITWFKNNATAIHIDSSDPMEQIISRLQ